ncbi:unnamed protein product, partial [Sphacelaria rigidula]
ATRLKQRVSEAFSTRRLCNMALRQWHLRVAYNKANRSFAHNVSATILSLSKRVALTKWRAAHAGQLSRKAAAATRQSRRPMAVSRLYQNGSSSR